MADQSTRARRTEEEKRQAIGEALMANPDLSVREAKALVGGDTGTVSRLLREEKARLFGPTPDAAPPADSGADQGPVLPPRIEAGLKNLGRVVGEEIVRIQTEDARAARSREAAAAQQHEGEVGRLNEDLKQAQAALAEVEAEARDAEAALEAERDAAQRDRDRVEAALGARVQDLEAESERRRAEAEREQAAAQAARAGESEARQKAATAEAHLEHARERVRDLEEALGQVRGELATSRSERDQALARATELERRVERLTDQLLEEAEDGEERSAEASEPKPRPRRRGARGQSDTVQASAALPLVGQAEPAQPSA